MSNHRTAAGHHLLPLSLYLAVGGTLLIMTVITIIVAQMDFGAWNLIIAMLIACFKATLVVLFFMHLKYDHKLYGVVFVMSLAFLAIFISFVMFDTGRRGDLDARVKAPIKQHAIIYDDAGKPLPMESRVLHPQAEGQAAPKENFELTHGFGPIKEEVKVGPLDTALATHGYTIFKVKCATCHRLDSRYTGPPLRGAAIYRSPTFIMNQILDPKQNVSNHPDMQAMLAQYMTWMTFQNVTHDDARALYEYLRYESGRPAGSPPPEPTATNNTTSN